ncbi:MAG: carboxypeptidase-like regulatory domain-containing protein [Planctomycetota bacterium]|nr:carboxypeptidase-like regulatory domain-containing protein [Planctomycetota bacterium]
MQRSSLPLVPVAALVLLSLWIWGRGPDAHDSHVPIPTARAGPVATQAPPPPAGLEAEVQSSVQGVAGEASLRGAVPIALPEEGPATIRGRVVRADGSPVSGASVALVEGADRPATWFLMTASSSVETGADGHFSLIAPERGGPRRLEFRAKGFVPAGSNLNEELAADGGDLGDTTLTPGVHAIGQAQGDGGMGGALVRLQQADSPAHHARLAHAAEVRTDASGEADFGWLPPGRYRLVPKDHLQEEATIVLLETGAEELRFGFELLEPEQWIHGWVVDRRAGLVPGARISVRGAGWGHRVVEADGQGRFDVPRVGFNKDTVELSALAPGFDLTRLERKVEWGESEVELVLDDSHELTVRVTASDDGLAVEDYTVWLAPTEPHALAPQPPGSVIRPVMEGPHPNGTRTLDGLRSCSYQVCVVPDESLGLVRSAYRIWEPGRDGALVEFMLERAVQRRARVTDDRGEPIAGCRVVLHGLGEQAGQRPSLARTEAWPAAGGAGWGLVLDEAIADEHGEIVLEGPGGIPLGVWLDGPGCEPAAVRLERLDAHGELRLVGQRPGQLELTVLGADLVTGLNEVLGRAPRLVLRPVGAAAPAKRVVHILSGPAASLELAEGTWSASLDLGFQEVDLGPALTIQGEPARLTLDLRPWEPARLEATVTEGGRPLEGASFEVQRWMSSPGSSEPWWRSVGRYEGGASGFVHHGLPGLHRLLVTHGDRPGDGAVARPGEWSAEPGSEQSITFSVAVGDLALTFVDAAGSPVAGVQGFLLFSETDEAPVTFLDTSDEHGRIHVPGLGAGTLRLSGHPRSLGTRNAKIAFAMESKSREALDAKRLDLGQVTIGAGVTTELRIELPETYFD